MDNSNSNNSFATDAASATSSGHHSSGGMSDAQQDERRKQIREIMNDKGMSQIEKRKSIQSLMDGRRRSSGGTRSVCSTTEETPTSYVSSMAAAAAAAADYYSSDDEGDVVMSDAGYGDGAVQEANSNYSYGYDRFDARSVASTISQHSQITATGSGIPVAAASYRQIHGRSYSLQDFNDNADRAYAAANTAMYLNNPAAVNRLMEHSRPECDHYDRNCTLISPCCGLAFGCRICHDECPVLPPPIALRSQQPQKQEQQQQQHLQQPSRSHHCKADRRYSMPLELGEDEDETHHPIDRFAIREVICRQCYTRQSSKTNNCINCCIEFGAYHCSICNLWMSKTDSPYHCEDCGFCRVGGRENFRHCHDCGMCIDALLFDDHNCKAGKYMSNCPICQEDLFSSRHASHEMPCGHAIHWHCFKELTSYDTRCPVCKKSAESPEQMAATWSAISMGIALQPVPPDLARVVNIYCNDCEERGTNRRWHFLGVRCMNCMSFNTNVEQILMQGRDAAALLDQFEASNAGDGGVPANISMPALYTSNTAYPSGALRADGQTSRELDDDDEDDDDDDDLMDESETDNAD